MSYETILTETRGAVGWITLNRPKALNALSSKVREELGAALSSYDRDPSIHVIVLTGSEKAFAAGADIKEMAGYSFADAFRDDLVGGWEAIARTRKPVIAAVAGYALGGGCELVMMCDIVIAADNAKFGQPEVTLGILPGMGGTQRLVRAIGKAKAMDMILTGRMIDAVEAEKAGLVARVVPLADLLPEAMATAEKIASLPPLAILAAKEAVGRTFETPLAEGLLTERRLFQALFATEDQKEGMAAFTEKRSPRFLGR